VHDLYFDNRTRTTRSRPHWFDDAGKPVSDDMLRSRSIYPVQQVQAEVDPLLHLVEWQDPADWPLVDGVYQRTQIVTNKPLLSVQFEALKLVDAAAEAARSAMLTPGSGQALEYQRTEAEARAWTEGANIADFPMLRAELEAMKLGNAAATIDDVVAEALSNANLWLEVGAAIKQVRRSAKVLIEFAQAPADCRTALDWAEAQFAEILKSGTFEPFNAG
jgi:hypothetical protein